MSSVRRFEDLVAWQLAVRLRDTIFRHTSAGLVARDGRFRDRIRSISRSPPAKLSEGFDRSRPREFAQFVRMARGALSETKNHILEGATREYFDPVDADAMLTLQRRAHVATTRLLAYLESCNGEAPTDWRQ